MTNQDMLTSIEYLREKANVSYEEAAELLERYDGNVMRVLVELEHQGKVYAQPAAGERKESTQAQYEQHAREAKQKAGAFWDKAMKTRIVVEKKGENGEKETIANVNAPFVAGAAIVAPWLAVATAGAAFLTGHNVKITQEKDDETEEKK